MSSTASSVRAARAAGSGGRASGRQAWSLLWRADRRLSALVVGWTLASAVTPVGVVVALGTIVGRVPDAVRSGISSAAGTRLIEALVLAGVIYAFALVLDPVGSALGTAAKARITGNLQQRLLTAVNAPVGVAHLEDAAVLDRLARAEGSLTGIFPGDAPVTWVGVLASRISGILGCAVVAIFSWWLGLLLLVMWLGVRHVMLAAVVRQATELRGQTTAMRRAWYFMAVGSKARDAKEVRVFGLDDFVADRAQAEYLGAIRAGERGLRAVHRRAVLCWLVVLAGYAVALATVATAARHHTIELRALAILLPMLAVTMAAGSVSFDDITLVWSLAALPDVDRLELELSAAADDRSATPAAAERRAAADPAAPNRAAPDRVAEIGDRPIDAVRFEGVRFRYAVAAADVLDGLDLELPAGTSTAIVGINGAGKSTLVNLLSRLRDPTAGRITVDGIDLEVFEPRQWQRAIAIMGQEPVRYPVSAYDNVAFGALEHRDDRAGIEDCARLSGFAEVVASLPDGWRTVLSRELPGGTDLSGGQWQRLALTRALFATRHGARLLVLDEPTAALDVRSEARFYGHFLEITRGLTTVVISHRFATVRRADRICVLDGGRITETGSHDELLAGGGSYARAYRVQAARFGGRT